MKTRKLVLIQYKGSKKRFTVRTAETYKQQHNFLLAVLRGVK